MTASGRTRRADAARIVVVVAPAGAEGDDVVAQLVGRRADLRVARAATLAEADAALREASVCLLVAAPALETSAVTSLLAAKARLRPDLPALVMRHRQAEEPESWAERGVGVLRCPLLPAALGRSVDVVLGLDLHPRTAGTRSEER